MNFAIKCYFFAINLNKKIQPFLFFFPVINSLGNEILRYTFSEHFLNKIPNILSVRLNICGSIWYLQEKLTF